MVPVLLPDPKETCSYVVGTLMKETLANYVGGRILGTRLGFKSIITVALLIMIGFVPFDESRVSVVSAETQVSGIIDVDTTWSKDRSPYLAKGNLVVRGSATLTIDAGVTVKFDGYYSLYIENGSLLVLGSRSDRVQFTSNEILKKPYDWGGIQINSTGLGNIEYCDIEYSELGIASYSPLFVYNSSVSNSAVGVVISMSSGSVIFNTTLTRNKIGVQFSQTMSSEIHSNRVFSNSKMGIWVRSGSKFNNISENVFSDNQIGIKVSDGSEFNNILMNRISNNDYGIWTDQASALNTISNNSLLGNAMLAINSDNPALQAMQNYFGTSDMFRIDKMVLNANYTSPLSKDPTGRTLRFVNDEIWTGNVTISRATIVNGTLVVSNATVTFDQTEGENLIQVNGSMVISNSRFESRTGFFTIFYVNGSAGLVSNSHFRGQRSMTIHTSSISVSNNSFHRGHVAITLGVDSFSNNISNNSIRDNSAVDDGPDMRYGMIRLHRSSQNTISENVISFNSGTGIFVSYSEGIDVIGNTIHTNTGRAHGVRLEYSTSSSITQNKIFLNEWAGISIDYSLFLDVSQNVIHDNFWGMTATLAFSEISNNTVFQNTWSVLFFSSNNNTLFGNEIYSNEVDGLEMRDSENETVQKNIIHSNGGHGMDLHIVSSIVRGNEVHGNNYSGILVIGENNTVAGNNVSSNLNGIHLSYQFPLLAENITLVDNNVRYNTGTGILLDNSMGALIYHNNIVANGIQASDNKNSNEWDNGYPLGGNYWSDYFGVDNCSGPNQNICPDPDDIGDIPYDINPSVEDRYPLMNSSIYLPPIPPELSSAYLNGFGYENVTIEWNLSKDDGAGLESVIGYQIYRNDSVYDSKGRGYQLIAVVPNGTSAYIDMGLGEGDPSNYFYQVCAVDILGGFSCSSNQAGKYTRHLLQGANLVSLPLVQLNRSIESVFQTLEFDKAWTYDTSDGMGKWKWYMRFKPYTGDLRELGHLEGIWVNVTEDSNLTVAGIVPRMSSVPLVKGWNLIGYPSFSLSLSVSRLKEVTGCDSVEAYFSFPPYYLLRLGDSDILEAGFGFWIRVELETAIVLVN